MASLVLNNIGNEECVICANNYTSHKRKKVSCGFCPFECCIECVKTYLLTQTSHPHCMSCKNQWDDSECDKKLGNFMHTKYRIHRKFMLFEGEKAKIPETMPAVENYLSINKWSKDAKELEKKIDQMEMQISLLRRERNKLIKNIDIVKRGEDPEEKKSEKRRFIRACPQNDCNGFLSSQWKCAVCKIEVCSECHEVKEEGHVCDENILATAKALKKDSKPCPGCSSLIFKISGCDQMWCTQCHIAFSWNTGKQVNGVVHNPHYYQWARENGGAPIQQPGAAGPCGGLPQFHQLIGQIRNYHESYLEFINYGKFFSEYERRACYQSNCGIIKWTKFLKKMWLEFPLEMTLTNIIDKVFSQHESITHFIHHEINRLREACQRQVDNKLLRIQYITKEKDEKSMKTTLLRRDNLFKKKNAMLQIYELAGQVFTEAIISAGQNPKATNLYKQLDKCEKLRLYCNEELEKVSKIYKQTVNKIDDNGRAFNFNLNNQKNPNTYIILKDECKKVNSEGFNNNLQYCLNKLDDKNNLYDITQGKFKRVLEENKFYLEWKRIYHRYHRRYNRNYL